MYTHLAAVVAIAATLVSPSPALAFTTGKEANHLCQTGKLDSLSNWTWVKGSAYLDQRLRCRELVPIRKLQPDEGIRQLRRELLSQTIIVKPAFLTTSGPQPAHHNGAYTDQRSAPAGSEFEDNDEPQDTPSTSSTRASVPGDTNQTAANGLNDN
jgi:hypothetical protein